MPNLTKLLDQLEAAIPDLRAAAESGYGEGIDSEEGEEELPELPPDMSELPPLPEDEMDEEAPLDLDTPPSIKKPKKKLPF